jgi:hypothetical protein
MNDYKPRYTSEQRDEIAKNLGCRDWIDFQWRNSDATPAEKLERMRLIEMGFNPSLAEVRYSF